MSRERRKIAGTALQERLPKTTLECPLIGTGDSVIILN